MNKKNIEIINVDILRNFKYQGQSYYIEIFHYIDGSIQAFANKRSSKVQHISEEFPIGRGWDPNDPTKAAVHAINNILNQ
ncbi:hypothetical protein ABLO26_24510 [Neobacillus sp. 179-J 1A1 HS]|uniref:hypothetical protein n=1 Tax=Neobacillus driksii TaxID=3035913 RepID=UPI0035BC4329